MVSSDSFTTLGLWVLGLATSNINESPLQTNESNTLFLMTSLQYYCIPGLAGTRWNKNLCAKDAGCAGNKITGFQRKQKGFPIISLWGAIDPRGVASLDPRGLIAGSMMVTTRDCFFVLIFTFQSTIFQSCRDRSSWVEPVLSRG